MSNEVRDKSGHYTSPKVEIDPRAIVAFTLKVQGLPSKEIAGIYGVDRRTVDRWLESVKDMADDHCHPTIKAAKLLIESMMPKALKTLSGAMDLLNMQGGGSTALKAAEHILKTLDILKDKHEVVLNDQRMTDDELNNELVEITKK